MKYKVSPFEMIMTENGYKSANELKLGDKLIDTRGNLYRIIEIYGFRNDSTLYSVSFNNDLITVGGEMIVIKKDELGKEKKVRVRDLCDGDYIRINKGDNVKSVKFNLNIPVRYTTPLRAENALRKYYERYENLYNFAYKEDFWWFCGYYASKRGKILNNIVHFDRVKANSRLNEVILKLGIAHTELGKDSKGLENIGVSHVAILKFLKDNIGINNKTKKLSGYFSLLPFSFMQAFMQGWLEGNSIENVSVRNKVEVYTIESAYVLQICLLSLYNQDSYINESEGRVELSWVEDNRCEKEIGWVQTKYVTKVKVPESIEIKAIKESVDEIYDTYYGMINNVMMLI